jgi:thioredoxin reductase
MEQLDIAIIGGGPAGLQAALVLARTRKHVVVFDSPTPPRNAASRGVHNFLGLDDMTPGEIRDRAWTQIDRYGTAWLERQAVTRIDRDAPDGDFVIVTDAGRRTARHVVLTCGYRDVYPDLDGFDECWANTIIPCPFCDGYENRDRTWGIVPTMVEELEVFPSMVRNWTSDRVVLAPRSVEVTTGHEASLGAAGVPLYRGTSSR